MAGPPTPPAVFIRFAIKMYLLTGDKNTKLFSILYLFFMPGCLSVHPGKAERASIPSICKNENPEWEKVWIFEKSVYETPHQRNHNRPNAAAGAKTAHQSFGADRKFIDRTNQAAKQRPGRPAEHDTQFAKTAGGSSA
jgi:hypothetical protein